MKKILTLVAVCALCAAATHATAQDYTLTRGVPGIVFGYPSDVPLTGDQSQVATVVWPNLSEVTYMGEYTLLAVDGARIPDRVRSSPFRRHETDCFAVDLLPGRHTLTFSYIEYLPLTGRRTYKVATPLPVDVAVEVEAGKVYQLRALLSNGAFSEFTIDNELTDPTIVDRLAQSRTISPLAYTPLAGESVTSQSAAPATASRRTVQPATPRGTTAQVTSEGRRMVEPAEPRRRRTVEPAEPKSVQLVTPPQSATQVAAVPAPVPATAATPISTQATQPSEGTTLLHIYRVRSMAGAAVGYDVHLGEQTLYRARNNSVATIPVSGAGVVVLWAKTEQRVDLPLDIEPGREYWVRCGIRMGAFAGRPVLERVDAATGRAEMERIPADRRETPPVVPVSIGTSVASPVPDVVPVAVEPEPEVIPEPVEPEVVPTPVASVTPEPEPVPVTPVEVVDGIGTLEIVSVALPDSVAFRPAVGIKIPSAELNVTFVSGTERFTPQSLSVSGTLGLSFDGGFIYENESLVIAKLSGAPAGFTPDTIEFFVSGRKMIYDIASGKWMDGEQ